MNFQKVGLVTLGGLLGFVASGAILIGTQLRFTPAFSPGKTMPSCKKWPLATRVFIVDVVDAPGQYKTFSGIPYVSKEPAVSRAEAPTVSGTEDQDPNTTPTTHNQTKVFLENTPFDLNLSLQQKADTNKHRYAIIKIRLLDPRFDFMDAKRSITIDPLDVNSRMMFCKLQTKDREITIKARYFRPWFSQGQVEGGFNIGVLVKTGVMGPGNKELVVPMFVDPKVSNNG